MPRSRVRGPRVRGDPADEPSPPIPGGGQAGWSLRQYPVARFPWIATSLLLLGAAFAVWASVLVLGPGPVTPADAEDATGLFHLAGGTVPLGVAGLLLFGPGWRRARIADDVQVHGVGMPVEVRPGPRGGLLETVTVDRRTFRIEGHGPPTAGSVTVDGAPHRLEVDGDERAAVRQPVTALGVRDPDTVVLHAEEHRLGRWSDWTIVVDGRTFRLRAPTAGARPRRATLLDDLGRAWLLRHRRGLEVDLRLPDELSDAGAVLVAWCLVAVVRRNIPVRQDPSAPSPVRRPAQ